MSKATRQAFTLMEVLLAIALIAIGSGLTALSVSLFSENSLKARPPDRIFCTALKRAQSEAILRGVTISLSYSKDGYFLLKEKESLREIARMWLSKELEDASKSNDSTRDIPNVDIAFIFNSPEVVGSENIEFKLKPATEIVVSPDGVCSPVDVYFTQPNEDPTVVKIDPMSASPRDF